MEKKYKYFACRALLLYVAHEVFIEILLFQKTCSAAKIPGCVHITLTPLFTLDSIVIFCYQKVYPFSENLFMTMQALRFENQKYFLQYYFEGDKKKKKKKKMFLNLNVCIRIFALETLVRVILKKEYIYFIYKYWHCNICQCYFKEDTYYFYSYLFPLLESSQGIQFQQFQHQ